MSQKGLHTWDTVIQYHCCPKCNKIIESREDYHIESKGVYRKDIQCPFCAFQFSLTRKRKVRFAPIW